MLSLLAIPSAQAQEAPGGTHRGPGPIGIGGRLVNQVMLVVSGSGSTALSGTSMAHGPGRQVGTVDFGSFSTVLQPGPTNGQGFRVSLPAAGVVVSATLSATIFYHGSPTATITVSRQIPAGPLPDLPLSGLRIASPARGAWSSGLQGTQVPDAGLPGFNPCQAAGDLTCFSGKPYRHSLALFLPDTRPAGPFHTTILYSGTVP
jgi:hypothetical protein